MSLIDSNAPTDATPAEGPTPRPESPPLRIWGPVLVAGLIAGCASWLIGEAIHKRYGPPDLVVIATPTGGLLSGPEAQKLGMAKRGAQIFEATLTFGWIGAILGLALGLAGGFVRREGQAALKAAIIGAIVGGIAGAAVTQATLPTYFRIFNPDTNELIVGIMLQVVIAAAIGAGRAARHSASGSAIGAASPAPVFGGLLGGIAGAFVYEMVGAVRIPARSDFRPDLGDVGHPPVRPSRGRDSGLRRRPRGVLLHRLAKALLVHRLTPGGPPDRGPAPRRDRLGRLADRCVRSADSPRR